MFRVCALFLVGFFVAGQNAQQLPPYIKKQCHSSDREIMACIYDNIHHVRPWLRDGIPEIGMPSVEPFIIDQLRLSLTNGPNGYKITLKDMNIFGASNFTLSKMKIGTPFEGRVKMPLLKIESDYKSSGVLLIIPASGNGTFNAVFEGVTADLKGKVVPEIRNGNKYLRVTNLEMDLKVKHVQMMVRKIFNNNRILIEATNLFLRENGQEVLKLMLPQLQGQLSKEFKKIANNLLVNVPLNLFYVED